MKKVFNNSDVPHIWSQQSQDAGRNSNGSLFFEGATIFSYGKHFPIATIEGNDVLFTLSSYSNTTAKHISKARGAISHKNIIWCYDVPVKYYGNDKPLNKQSFTLIHSANLNYWKGNIKKMMLELGNKRNKPESRLSVIQTNVNQLQAYCKYFSLPIKDKELKTLLSLVKSPDFIEKAREAKAKQDAANERKIKQGAKAYQTYLDLWRKYDDEAIKDLPSNLMQLIRYYEQSSDYMTRLRYNKAQKRLETSKGVQIPVEIAKRAYVQLNGCIEGSCKDLSIPVMNYTITETGKDYIKAGCHTIPKEDVKYIANLLKW
jgi:hypothetical protein